MPDKLKVTVKDHDIKIEMVSEGAPKMAATRGMTFGTHNGGGNYSGELHYDGGFTGHIQDDKSTSIKAFFEKSHDVSAAKMLINLANRTDVPMADGSKADLINYIMDHKLQDVAGQKVQAHAVIEALETAPDKQKLLKHFADDKGVKVISDLITTEALSNDQLKKMIGGMKSVVLDGQITAEEQTKLLEMAREIKNANAKEKK